MSGNSHKSPIKTPKQLVTLLVLAFVVPIVVIVLLSQLATSGWIFDKDSPAMSPKAVAQRIKPVAEVTVEGAGPGAKALGTAAAPAAAQPAPTSKAVAAAADGKKVYESTCIACHGAGVANAPKFGDKKAWAMHLMQGTEHLYGNALKGIGAMPPRGGNLTLSDAEVKAAVDYMVKAVK
jgi:cytochrome c5